MPIDKIVGLIGIAVAIVAAFVPIPHVFAILVVAGLIAGFRVAGDDQLRVILTAIGLLLFANTFFHVPYVGKYIQMILEYGSNMAMGAALMVILRNLYQHFRLGFEARHELGNRAGAR